MGAATYIVYLSAWHNEIAISIATWRRQGRRPHQGGDWTEFVHTHSSRKRMTIRKPFTVVVCLDRHAFGLHVGAQAIEIWAKCPIVLKTLQCAVLDYGTIRRTPIIFKILCRCNRSTWRYGNRPSAMRSSLSCVHSYRWMSTWRRSARARGARSVMF